LEEKRGSLSVVSLCSRTYKKNLGLPCSRPGLRRKTWGCTPARQDLEEKQGPSSVGPSVDLEENLGCIPAQERQGCIPALQDLEEKAGCPTVVLDLGEKRRLPFNSCVSLRACKKRQAGRLPFTCFGLGRKPGLPIGSDLWRLR
jgi:hypothetical protein